MTKKGKFTEVDRIGRFAMQAWSCHVCSSDNPPNTRVCRTPGCRNPRINPHEGRADPVPETVSIFQVRQLDGDYGRWPPQQYGDIWVAVVVAQPRPTHMEEPWQCRFCLTQYKGGSDEYKCRNVLCDQPRPIVKEPAEMRRLLEWGWVRAAPGVMHRRIEPPKTLIVAG